MRWLPAVLLVLGVGLSPAFACAPQPLISLDPRASSGSGAAVGLDGLRFSVGPVEVRWNTVDGPLLATATGPDFHADVRIPEAPPGLYALVVLSRGADGSVGLLSRASFEVTDGSGLPATTPARATGAPPARPAGGRSGLAVAGMLGAGALGGGTFGVWAGRRSRRGRRPSPGVPAGSRQPAGVPSPAP